MKPLYLEIQAFGPYIEKQSIDFKKLGEKGIFLIKGNTGSGKTTIFDAMTFALYGGGSGDNDKTKSGRNDLEEWRCTQANADLDTFVSFTFSIRNHTYYFKRTLTQKRKNLSPEYEAGEIDEEGTVIPFFDNPKKELLTEKAIELIGLNKEQFRQVVLLPQGQFERFLTASSSEKEEILQKIFRTEHWSNYTQAFFDKANIVKNNLEEEKKEIINSLNEEDFSELDDLKNHITALKKEMKDIEKRHKDFNGGKKQKDLNSDIKIAEQFKPLHELEEEKNKLLKEKDIIDNKRLAYEGAEQAEKARDAIDKYESSVKDYNERKANLEKLNRQLPNAEKKKNDADQKKKDLENNSPINELNKAIGIYESKKSLYESIDQEKNIFNKAQDEFNKTQAKYIAIEKSLETAKEEAIAAKVDFDFEDSKAKEYRDKYYFGIYGEIASKLIDSEKCPICGSTVHPDPAQKISNSISKDELDTQEEKYEAAKIKWNQKEEQRKNVEQKLQNEKKELDDKKKQFTESETKYISLKNDMINGISDITALENAIKNAYDKIKHYDIELDKIKKDYNDANTELISLKENIKTANNELETSIQKSNKNKDELDKIIFDLGFDDYLHIKNKLIDSNNREMLHQSIVEYETKVKLNEENLSKKQTELVKKIEPDSNIFEERQSEITKESDDYKEKSTKCKTSIDRLTKKLNALEAKELHFNANIQQAENDLAFAKKIRGDTGIGLQRYVLAILFNQVISEANCMLAKVHGGRYHLFRSDERVSGNKRGLELKVHDNRSPEKEGRSVTMLSGGEKFLVSLSLSIGMSTVAQKSGVQIEALFIDEGFGTLDDKSIDDAMNVLDSVRKGSGMIGIISHVQVLQDNIPTHLNVIKSDKGSSISLM